MKTRFATAYNFRNVREGTSFATMNTEESLTQQSDANDTDINVIMARYQKTGQLPQLTNPGEFGDFTTVTDYRTALDMVRHADEKFAEVPAKIREQFDNDAQKFIDFAENPANIDKMREWKLAPPAEPAILQREPAIPPAEEYDDEGPRPRAPVPPPAQRTENGNRPKGNEPTGPAGNHPARPRNPGSA